jgi:hypothetical protein
MIARRDRKEATRAGLQGSKASYWPRRMIPTLPQDSYILGVFRAALIDLFALQRDPQDLSRQSG